MYPERRGARGPILIFKRPPGGRAMSKNPPSPNELWRTGLLMASAISTRTGRPELHQTISHRMMSCQMGIWKKAGKFSATDGRMGCYSLKFLWLIRQNLGSGGCLNFGISLNIDY